MGQLVHDDPAGASGAAVRQSLLKGVPAGRHCQKYLTCTRVRRGGSSERQGHRTKSDGKAKDDNNQEGGNNVPHTVQACQQNAGMRLLMLG